MRPFVHGRDEVLVVFDVDVHDVVVAIGPGGLEIFLQRGMGAVAGNGEKHVVDAIGALRARREITRDPVHGAIAAVSVGVYRGVPVLDLDYAEDSDCDTDMNVVMNDGGGFIEVQGTAEGHAFRRAEMDAMLQLAEAGVAQLVALQREALAG